eukprot:CAMPEP_0172653080 /NCGR_PEP_ID=MMETSP1068-20121228/243645_1 /TAXON_ID=35684 /ORGANISM="Pseudopedinella elastica, Strain CCMP716" /LENGTH=45 /DNA_ID= /DNA_START= /DNA_END= /DNA_ORIENTATION=
MPRAEPHAMQEPVVEIEKVMLARSFISARFESNFIQGIESSLLLK